MTHDNHKDSIEPLEEKHRWSSTYHHKRNRSGKPSYKTEEEIQAILNAQATQASSPVILACVFAIVSLFLAGYLYRRMEHSQAVAIQAEAKVSSMEFEVRYALAERQAVKENYDALMKYLDQKLAETEQTGSKDIRIYQDIVTRLESGYQFLDSETSATE